MNKKTIMLTLAMALIGAAPTQAQTRDSVAFEPHWYVQPQVGVGYHVGEAKMGDLLSPTAALSLGRQFSPVFGLRLGASGWQARNWQGYPKAEYKWNYVQANLDATVSLTNLIWGWKDCRKWNVYALAGVGLDIAFKNDDANRLAATSTPSGQANGGFEKLWDGTKLFPAGRVGGGIEYALSERVALGLEYNANVLPDKWNSKKGKNDNLDWQQNLLLGVKIALGKTRKHIAIEEPVIAEPEPEPVAEPVAEPVVEEPVVAETSVAQETQEAPETPSMPEAKVYFSVSSSRLTASEEEKLQPVLEYLQKYTDTEVTICGYASTDGKKAYNQRLSQRRAKAVEKWFVAKGIDASRIKSEGKGEVDFGSRKESRAAATIQIEK